MAADSRPSTSASASSASEVTPRSRNRYLYPRAVSLPLHTLTKHYSQVLFAYGCSQSRLLGIPGSEPGELANVYTALDVVNWYNGHPTAHDPEILAQEPWRRVDLSGIRDMDIIGAGNVALDVARIVLRASTVMKESTKADVQAQARGPLLDTDVPEPVMAHLTQSRIDTVGINARRGPAQVAFTNKELRERPEHVVLRLHAFADIEGTNGKRSQVSIVRQLCVHGRVDLGNQASPSCVPPGRYYLRNLLLDGIKACKSDRSVLKPVDDFLNSR